MPPEHPNPAAPSEHSQPPPPAAVKGKEKLKKKEADDLVCPLTKGSLIFFNFFLLRFDLMFQLVRWRSPKRICC
jgi:hypothetical protein